MKLSALLILLSTLLAVHPALAGEDHSPLGGVFYVCTNDLDQERRFLGMSGNDSMEDEAKKLANEKCDDLSGGVAIQVVYVYKDGSQRGN
jgi:hypothetical protein